MQYNPVDFSEEYHRVSQSLRKFRLPTWEEFPDFDLYMDQMVSLINGYLFPFHAIDHTVTPSMINNYVKAHIMPPPTKKRYGKTHLAYLVVICSLKDAVGTSDIQRIFPPHLSGEELRTRYNAFIENQVKSYLYFAEAIDAVAYPLLKNEANEPNRIHDLVMQVANSANIAKALVIHFATMQTEESAEVSAEDPMSQQ